MLKKETQACINCICFIPPPVKEECICGLLWVVVDYQGSCEEFDSLKNKDAINYQVCATCIHWETVLGGLKKKCMLLNEIKHAKNTCSKYESRVLKSFFLPRKQTN